MKLAQTQNVFIVDYVATNKFYLLDLFLHFVDLDNFVSNPMRFMGLIHGWGLEKRKNDSKTFVGLLL
jgi:hypothetical protein